MSKYIKLEDAIHNIDLEVTGRKEYTGNMKANLFFALDDLPSIELSEDCISREWVLREFEKGKEKISKSEYFDELMWLVKHAPSVVPAYQPITIKTDEKDSKSLKEQLKDIKTPGILMTEEEYGLFGCRVRTVEHAPSVVSSGTNVECYARNCEKNKNGRCEEADIILEFGCGDYKKEE